MRTTFCIVLALLLVLPVSAQPVHGQQTATVVVDAGHGGTETGTASRSGLQEKTVNLDIAQRLQTILLDSGYNVKMTRDTDATVSLGKRVEIAREQADLFVSVHANDHSDPDASGSLVLYYDSNYPQAQYPASKEMIALSSESKRLATLVLQQMVHTVGLPDQGIVPSSAYVVRMGSVPSILVETGFLSHKGDAEQLAKPAIRQQFAEAIAAGIVAYLPLTPTKPSPFFDMNGHWSLQAVSRLAGMGLVEGIAGRYEPDRAMTRAEWLTICDRLFHFAAHASELPAADRDAAIVRDDLSPSHWAYNTFQYAMKLGWINGYEDGRIRPDQPVTRSEAAALWLRMTGQAEAKKWPGPYSFTDVPASYWAVTPIYTLQQQGLLQGVSPSSFAPGRPMTRAEMAAMVDRFLE